MKLSVGFMSEIDGFFQKRCLQCAYTKGQEEYSYLKV